MSDGDNQEYLNVVGETLQRLQIEPRALFAYVEELRMRYIALIQALVDITSATDVKDAHTMARDALYASGIKSEGNVSHETNEQDV